MRPPLTVGRRRSRTTTGRAPGLSRVVALGGLSALGGTVSTAIGDAPAQDASPRIVGPGRISTAAVEHGAALTPDGGTLYFTRTTDRWGAPGGRSAIYVSRLEAGAWSEPTSAPFTGEFDDADPFVSPDGRELFFTSTRPVPGGEPGGFDIWVYRLGDGPGARPRHLSSDVNSSADEYSPVVTAAGHLYFASDREGGLGQGDLYVAPRREAGYGPARNLGPVLNTPFGEWNLVVDPDEGLLIFEGSGRALNRSASGDLYVSFRETGAWTAPVSLASINTPGSELMPRLSPDGTLLYYASSAVPGSDHTDVFVVGLEPLLERARARSRDVLLVVSRSGHHVALIDPQNLQVLRRLETGVGPHEVAVLTGARAIVADYGVFPTPHEDAVPSHPGWVERPEGNTVTVVDLEGRAPAATIELPECARAHGVLSSLDGSTAWATCEEEAAVVEMDVTDARVIRRWETGYAGSHRLVATHDDRYLIVANVDAGNVTVIDRRERTREVLATGAGSEGMEAAADGTVWVLASGEDALVQLDPSRAAILRTLPSGGRVPISVGLDEERAEAWVAHLGSRSVDVIRLETGERIDRIPFDSAPLRVLIVPGSRHAYVSLPRENAVAVVDRSRRTVVGRIGGIMEVDGLAWTTIDPR